MAGQAGKPIKQWDPSAGIPGIDALHSFAAEPRVDHSQEVYAPLFHIQHGDGTYYNPRLVAPTQADADARDYREKEIRDKLTTQTSEGLVEERHTTSQLFAKRPLDNVDNTANRPLTQNRGPQMYRFARTMGLPLGRAFSGEHVSFASPPKAAIGAYGSGRAGRRTPRTTERVVPQTSAQTTVSLPEQVKPGSPIPSGSSLTRYW